MVSNFTTLDSNFKQTWLKRRPLADLCYEEVAMWGLLPRITTWVGGNTASSGDALKVPLKFARPPSISGKLSTAQNRAANTSSQVTAWLLTSNHLYGDIQIDVESAERSQGQEGAFAELKMLEVEGMEKQLNTILAYYAYGDGSGVLAQVGNSTQQSTFATSTCTLLNPEDAVKLEIGFELTVSGSSTGTERALGSNGHGLYVIAVNTDAGTFQVGNVSGTAVNLNDAADGIPTIANSDFLTLRDTRGAVLNGFQAFIPQASPSTALFGVTQSNYPTRLAGSRFNGSSYDVLEAILRGVNQNARNGGRVKTCFINYKHYSDLVNSIAARGIVNFITAAADDRPNIGYEGVRIIGAKGSVDVIPDYPCPSTLAAGMLLDDWAVISVGDTVKVMGGDGLEFLRMASLDNIECRMGSYSQAVALAPVNNVNIQLAA